MNQCCLCLFIYLGVFYLVLDSWALDQRWRVDTFPFLWFSTPLGSWWSDFSSVDFYDFSLWRLYLCQLIGKNLKPLHLVMKVTKCILSFEQWSKMHVTTGSFRWKREWDRVSGLNGTSPLPHIQTDKPALPSAHGAGSNYNGKMHRSTRTKTWKKKKTCKFYCKSVLGEESLEQTVKKKKQTNKKKKTGDGGRLREVGGDGGEVMMGRWGEEKEPKEKIHLPGSV